MRLFKPLLLALLSLAPWLHAQVPAPQINLAGNIGCQGFPCLNNGILTMTDASRAMTAQETSAVGGFKVTGTWTANRTLTMPVGRFQFVSVENATTGGFSLILASASGGTSLTIPNGQSATGVWFDGTNVTGTLPGGGCTSGCTFTTSTINGVNPTTGGSSSTFLNGAGSYTTPAGSGNTTSTTLGTNIVPKSSGANSIVQSSIQDDGTTVSTAEPVSTSSLITGTPSADAKAALPPGAHGIAGDESSTAGVPAAGVDYLRWDSVTHGPVGSFNGVAESPLCQLSGAHCIVSSLTTTGSSGAATLSGGVLNIPNYAGGGGSSNPSTCTSNSTGNKCLGVSPYVAISGDYTVAIQQAITDLTSDGGGTLWVPCHATYPVAGALQDTSGANAQIVLPPTPLVVGTTIPIRIAGMCNPNVFGGVGNAVLQTTLNTAGGSFIGGYVSTGPFGGFINTDFVMQDIQIHTTATNPAMTMVNAKFFPTAQLSNVSISSAAPATPAATTGMGYISPVLSNNVSVSVDHLTVVGFYALAQFSEHMHIGHLEGANSHLGYVFDTEPGTDPSHSTWGNTISVDYMWCQLCDYEISAGTSQTTVNVQVADFEVAPTAVVNDPSNLLLGDVYYNVPYTDGRSTSTIFNGVKNGGANIRLHNLKYPGIAFNDGTGAGSGGASSAAINWFASSLTPDVSLGTFAPGRVAGPGSIGMSTSATTSNFANFFVTTTAEPAVFSTYTSCTAASCFASTTSGLNPNAVAFDAVPSTYGSTTFPVLNSSAFIHSESGLTAGMVIDTQANAPILFGINSVLQATLNSSGLSLNTGLASPLITATSTTGATPLVATSNADVVSSDVGSSGGGAYEGLTSTSSGVTWWRHVLPAGGGGQECQWNNSVHSLCWSATKVTLPSGSLMGWASALPESSAMDTDLSRDSAGVVNVGDGTAGSKNGTLNLAAVSSAAALTLSGATGITQSVPSGHTVETFINSTSTFQESSAANSSSVPLVTYTLSPATNVANFNSPEHEWTGNYWTGTATANDNWHAINVLGAGSNPTSTLTFSHGGSSGAAAVAMPALSVGGSPVCTAATGCTSGLVSQTATITAGFGGTSTVCASGFTCSSIAGTITVSGTGIGTGTIATISWPVAIAVNFSCTATQAGGTTATFLDIGAGASSGGTSFPITASVVSGASASYNVAYSCLAN